VARVSAPEIEAAIVRALQERWPEESDNRALIQERLERAVVHLDRIDLVLRTDAAGQETTILCDPVQSAPLDGADDPVECSADLSSEPAVLSLPWCRPASTRRREIIRPSGITLDDPRPIRAERRATLVRAIALGRRWLTEIVDGRVNSPAAIAERESCSKRHVTMTLSLAFLSPDLVQAAVEGQLPRGAGLTSFTDPPLAWSHQHRMLV